VTDLSPRCGKLRFEPSPAAKLPHCHCERSVAIPSRRNSKS